jgi:hypothetical protein
MSVEAQNLLVGMKHICSFLNVSETTALKWHRELGLPIKKTSKSGYWVGSRVAINEWCAQIAITK